MLCFSGSRWNAVVGMRMSARLSCSGAWLSSVAMLVALLAPRRASAQRTHGSLGVAATILPAVPTHAARLISMNVERDGIVRLETAPPRIGSVTQIVMCTVSSSANGFVPVEHAPILVEMLRGDSPGRAPLQSGRRAPQVRFDLDVAPSGAVAPDSSTRDVTLRIDYLVVPGT